MKILCDIVLHKAFLLSISENAFEQYYEHRTFFVSIFEDQAHYASHLIVPNFPKEIVQSILYSQ
jgi:hypothetical protein